MNGWKRNDEEKVCVGKIKVGWWWYEIGSVKVGVDVSLNLCILVVFLVYGGVVDVG